MAVDDERQIRFGGIFTEVAWLEERAKNAQRTVVETGNRMFLTPAFIHLKHQTESGFPAWHAPLC